VDLRNDRIFTIDGPKAKDFDDAVSIEKREDGAFKLGVHIADVSHYVEEDSRIDKEALRRGTSVYPVDQVIPMIPLALSNGICSLNQGVDRLTLTVDMLVDTAGRVLRHRIYESVIRSKARLVYGDVSDLLEGLSAGASGCETRIKSNIGSELTGDLKLMEELANILRDKREKRGSIDFDLDETEIELDESGIAINVCVAERRTANRMIEEFMLLANETVAEEFNLKNLPFVYRIHEKPGLEKLMEFKQFTNGLGIGFPGIKGEILPSDFGEIINKVRDKPYEKVVNTVMLRTMQKAYYGTDCLGHFGLAVKYYCHFTSPIRRYPDLIVHRIIKESLHSKIQGVRRSELLLKTVYAAELSSETERKALELEREAEKIKKAEYISFHLGEQFDGVISGVVSFGFFVELPNTVEGLVRVDHLYDDYYFFDPEHYCLVGETNGRKYTLGDELRVKVDSVNVERGEVNFILVARGRKPKPTM
jgi:ribonuclease R